MILPIQVWEFLAGLGIFLMGMAAIEQNLNVLAGSAFKKFLRKNTNHPIKGILSGILVTAILQSSSVVTLMVLAFVGAGIIELRNAIGIVIGANLGTTLTGWIVAFLGFQFNIENFALPFIAVGGLWVLFFSKNEKQTALGQFVIGFGFLFLGLSYMKSSIDQYVQGFDISPFIQYGPFVLFLIGFFLAALIHSSSAVMVIALSALNAQMISLEAAAAMAVGSDLGTTITALFSGLKGNPAKKRVAMSHFLFNFIVDVLALIFLFPLLDLVKTITGFQNPLFVLVAFHSSFNLIGILLFLPFLKYFALFLERLFKKDDSVVALFIQNIPATVPEVAIEGLKKEVRHLLERVFYLHATVLAIDPKTIFNQNQPDWKKMDSAVEMYESIKELEGELVEFYIALQSNKLQAAETILIQQLVESVRYAMSAAKTVKDISHNLKDFNRSANDHKIALNDLIRVQQIEFYKQLFDIFHSQTPALHFENLMALKEESKSHYDNFIESASNAIRENRFTDLEISTLFNVNRELHHANKSLINAVKDYLLDQTQAADFERVN